MYLSMPTFDGFVHSFYIHVFSQYGYFRTVNASSCVSLSASSWVSSSTFSAASSAATSARYAALVAPLPLGPVSDIQSHKKVSLFNTGSEGTYPCRRQIYLN